MLSNKELYLVKGGSISITASLISNVLAVANRIYELGRTVGTIVRRIYDKNICNSSDLKR